MKTTHEIGVEQKKNENILNFLGEMFVSMKNAFTFAAQINW